MARRLLGLLLLTTLFSSCTSIVDPRLTPHSANTQPDNQVWGNGKPRKEEGAQGSWTTWARDKITEDLGHKHENAKLAARQMKEVTDDIAKKTKEKMLDAASEATKITAHKVGEVKDVLMNTGKKT